jgi:dethiobiotin synthetase
LRLVPLEEKVEEIVESVLVEGEGGIITQYTITESNGDYTATSLYDENRR